MKPGLKINKKELLNMALGMLAVKAAPVILNKIMPNSTLNMGVTGSLLAGAIGVGVGIAMKSQTVQTVAAATALTELVSDTVVEPLLAKVIPSPAPAKTGRLNNYTMLRDFPKKLNINRSYANAYS